MNSSCCRIGERSGSEGHRAIGLHRRLPRWLCRASEEDPSHVAGSKASPSFEMAIVAINYHNLLPGHERGAWFATVGPLIQSTIFIFRMSDAWTIRHGFGVQPSCKGRSCPSSSPSWICEGDSRGMAGTAHWRLPWRPARRRCWKELPGFRSPKSCHLVEIRGLLSALPLNKPSAMGEAWPWQSSVPQRPYGHDKHRWRMGESRERSRGAVHPKHQWRIG